VEKIKTVGATYMAAAGLNHEHLRLRGETSEDSVCDLVEFAFAMKQKLEEINGDAFNNFQLRVGICSGPLVGAGGTGGGGTGPCGMSTVSSPTAMMSAPLEVQLRPRNGACSIQNLAEAIDGKGLIIEDESTTDWIPEIPFKNVRSLTLMLKQNFHI